MKDKTLTITLNNKALAIILMLIAFSFVQAATLTPLGDAAYDKIPYTGANRNVDLGIYNLSAEFFSGQPLDGSIGSGVLNASSLKINCGCINVSDEGDLNVTYPDMLVKIWNYDANTYCAISGDTITVSDDAHTVYYVNSTCDIQTATWENYFAFDLNPPTYARLFDVYTLSGDIEVVKGASVLGLVDRQTKWVNVNCGEGGHLRICDGFDVELNSFSEINQTSGHFNYIHTVVISQARDSAVNGIHVVSASDGAHSNETQINITACDNGTSLDACSTNQYRRYIIYSIGWGDHTMIHQLAPVDSETYTTLSNCINTQKNPLSYALPTIDEGVAVIHHFYCGKRDDTAWRDGWVDIRIGVSGFGASPDLSGFMVYDEWSSNANANDFNLTNLDEVKAGGFCNATDCYTITQLLDDTDTNCTVAGSCPTVVYADGSVALTGNWAAGDYNITGLDELEADRVKTLLLVSEDNITFDPTDERVTIDGTLVLNRVGQPTTQVQLGVFNTINSLRWQRNSDNLFGALYFSALTQNGTLSHRMNIDTSGNLDLNPNGGGTGTLKTTVGGITVVSEDNITFDPTDERVTIDGTLVLNRVGQPTTQVQLGVFNTINSLRWQRNSDNLFGALYFSALTQNGTLSHRMYIDTSGNFIPASDNTYDLGSSSQAWKDIYYEGSITDTNPTFTREEIKEITGKNPHELLRDFKHNPDGHLNDSSIPDFLKPCKRWKTEREDYIYTINMCYDDGEKIICVDEKKYNTTQKQDVELCDEFGGGIKIDEYTNLVALAWQELEETTSELERRVEVLESTVNTLMDKRVTTTTTTIGVMP